MELKEFAELILFGTNVSSDKLLEPKILTDEKPYNAIIAPKSPGRPYGLRFNENLNSKKIPFPNKEQIEDEKQRGIVLHFFANHELLAMEIMALVLLLFPNAPKSFRMGIAKTIIEEQKHMNLYLKRMEEFNVSFGEIPVNDFFWNCLSQMKSPIDFVTKMSMTFEQANLDYSLFYRDLMYKINDFKTAEILETVYLEEIGHVKHGVTWFNRWRDQSKSDWESYVEALEPPLTPARAKGTIFDIEGRKIAGFSEEFISELSVFSSSKGRPPNVYYFNPACEQEIARDTLGFTPNKSVLSLENDCASLMQFFASKDDIILIAKKPSISFLKKIQSCGYTIPEWLEFKKNKIDDNIILQNYISSLNPWGWSPESIHLLKNLKSKLIVKSTFQSEIFDSNFYNKNIKKLYAKTFSADLIQKIQTEFHDISEILTTDDTLPSVSSNLEDITAIIEKYLAIENINIVVLKAPYGSSGQNMLRLKSSSLTFAEINWLKRILREQHAIVIEPWFEKIVDLSYQSKVTEDKKFVTIGMTRFICDSRGQYKSTFVGKKTDDLSKDLTKFMYSKYANYSGVEEILMKTSLLISSHLSEFGFEGPFGIDAFIYKDMNSKYGFRLKYLSEINPRYTMGRVAIEIAKRIHVGAFAIWAHIRIADILNDNIKSVSEFTSVIEEKFPTKLSNDFKPLIKEGILFTNDPTMATSVLTVLIVGKNVLQEFTNFTKIEIMK